MSDDLNDLDAGLGHMGAGIRRAHAAFAEADEGFLQALEALKQITLARGTLDERWRDIRETVARLEAMILEQGHTLLAQEAAIRALREGR